MIHDRARAGRVRVLSLLALLAITQSCYAQDAVPASSIKWRALDSPAGEPCAEPRVACGADGRFHVSWTRRSGGGRHALMFASGRGDAWSKPVRIANGSNWFVNWADFPSLAVSRNGSMAAHWLERNGAGSYAYGVRIAFSRDAGRTWSKPAWLHTDRSSTEHGFCSLVPLSGGRFSAVWLDGRAMEKTHDMTLRTVTLDPQGVPGKESMLDARACECCATAAVASGDGIVVAYRDRSDGDVRDISVVCMGAKGKWSEPRTIHADGWETPG